MQWAQRREAVVLAQVAGEAEAEAEEQRLRLVPCWMLGIVQQSCPRRGLSRRSSDQEGEYLGVPD